MPADAVHIHFLAYSFFDRRDLIKEIVRKEEYKYVTSIIFRFNGSCKQ